MEPLKRFLGLGLLGLCATLHAVEPATAVPREKNYPDIGKLHLDEARLIYGFPTSTESVHGGVNILRWSRTSSSSATDDWVATPFQRIPPGQKADPNRSFTMALEFDSHGVLVARRFEGTYPGMGDHEALFRRP